MASKLDNLWDYLEFNTEYYSDPGFLFDTLTKKHQGKKLTKREKDALAVLERDYDNARKI